MFKKIIALSLFTFVASTSFAGELISFEVKRSVAKFCGSKKVLLNSVRFRHSSTSRVINLIGENDILDEFKLNEVVCGEGSFRINDLGIVGHIYVYINEVYSQDGDNEADIKVQFKKLRSGKLADAVEEVSDIWADGNISTGTTRLRGGILFKSLKLDKKTAKANFEAEFKYNDRGIVPANSKLTSKSRKMSGAIFKELVNAIARSNDYATQCDECFDDIKSQLRSVVKLLGTYKSLQVLSTKTQFEDDVTESLTGASSYLIVNKKTRKSLRLFLIDGTM